jgi:hypothetical protein
MTKTLKAGTINMDKTTTTVAAVGITMPAWLPSLEEASRIAGHLVPILSATWLLVQIVRLISRWAKPDA